MNGLTHGIDAARRGGSGSGGSDDVSDVDVHIINREIHICETQLPGGNGAPVSTWC